MARLSTAGNRTNRRDYLCGYLKIYIVEKATYVPGITAEKDAHGELPVMSSMKDRNWERRL
jgi:hypothetical protein